MYVKWAGALRMSVSIQRFCVCATLNAHVSALVYIHECVFMLAEGEHVYASVCVHPKCIMCVFWGQ